MSNAPSFWLGTLFLGCVACDTPQTFVVLENAFPATASKPYVISQGFWQAVSFAGPIPPGDSSPPTATVAASANTAFVLVAPGEEVLADGGPATGSSLLVLESDGGFGVELNQTLFIPVRDATFVGDCAGGSPLSQDEADFITQRVFESAFSGLVYDAATCTTQGIP
jgi:hypothetical protein